MPYWVIITHGAIFIYRALGNECNEEYEKPPAEYETTEQQDGYKPSKPWLYH